MTYFHPKIFRKKGMNFEFLGQAFIGRRHEKNTKHEKETKLPTRVSNFNIYFLIIHTLFGLLFCLGNNCISLSDFSGWRRFSFRLKYFQFPGPFLLGLYQVFIAVVYLIFLIFKMFSFTKNERIRRRVRLNSGVNCA